MIGTVLLQAATTGATTPPVDPWHFSPVQIVIGLFALIAAIGGILGIVKFFRDLGKDKDGELREGQETILKRMGENDRAMGERMADLHRQTCEDIADVESDIEKLTARVDTFMPEAKIEKLVVEKVDDLKHKHAGELQKLVSRVDRIETSRTADVERIVKLETNMANIEKGQERIEHAVEKNHQETLSAMKTWADQFSTSIREVRDVRPRPSNP